MKFLSVFALGVLFAANAHASVWDDQAQWSVDWEAKYGKWVASEFKADLFAVKTGNPLAMPVNTVELPYLARAVFSARNHLPFIVRSRSNSRAFVSNRSAAWDAIAAGDERLGQFLRDIRVNISFDRLSLDSFPLALTKQAVQPGVFYISYRSFTDPDAAASALFLKTINDDTAFQTFLFATRSDEVRTLTERALVVVAPPSGQSGFMALRWPNENLNGLENHAKIKDPRFSATAQYQTSMALNPAKPDDSFTFKMQEAISGSRPNAKQQLHQDAFDLCLTVRSRVDWVNEALEHLSTARAANPAYVIARGTAAWERLSTPSRDGQILERFSDIRRKYRTSVPDAAIEAEYAACQINYGSAVDQVVTLSAYRKSVLAKLVGNDPNLSLEERWGLPALARVPAVPAPVSTPAPVPAVPAPVTPAPSLTSIQ